MAGQKALSTCLISGHCSPPFETKFPIIKFLDFGILLFQSNYFENIFYFSQYFLTWDG